MNLINQTRLQSAQLPQKGKAALHAAEEGYEEKQKKTLERNKAIYQALRNINLQSRLIPVHYNLSKNFKIYKKGGTPQFLTHQVNTKEN